MHHKSTILDILREDEEEKELKNRLEAMLLGVDPETLETLKELREKIRKKKQERLWKMWKFGFMVWGVTLFWIIVALLLYYFKILPIEM